MTPDEWLRSKGYTKPNYVTQSRIIVCELLNEYADLEYQNAIKAGYEKGIHDSVPEKDEFAARFAMWINYNCDSIDLFDSWYYYDKNGETTKKTTAELLKIFKDEMDKKS